MERQQSLDAADDPCALLDQVLALTCDPLGVFLLDSRNTHGTGNARIAK